MENEMFFGKSIVKICDHGHATRGKIIDQLGTVLAIEWDEDPKCGQIVSVFELLEPTNVDDEHEAPFGVYFFDAPEAMEIWLKTMVKPEPEPPQPAPRTQKARRESMRLLAAAAKGDTGAH
jgi:hypothetical protein